VAEITTWVDPEHWGEGIATRAMLLFLDALRERPVRARVAADNAGSIAVLEKLGFRRVGTETSFANARNADIEERIYRLD
jgi:RimJ/RimL family protein N-acetyltransferase